MTTLLPNRPLRVVAWGLLLWFVGMVVGSVVFAVPQLKAAPTITYVTANPFITVPIIVLWAPLAWVLVRGRLSRSHAPVAEGLRVGLVLLAVNMLLDFAVVVGLMKAGPRFYSYAGLWLAYAELIVVPWMIGRAASRAIRPVGPAGIPGQ